MSDNSPFGFGRFVPGFDFLQNLAKNSAASVPGMPGWVAPTVSEEELEKRIEELKAVQFWLDQNSRALTATVQSLEVQKMTLATLKGMNVAMGDLASAFAPRTSEPAPAAASSTSPSSPSSPSSSTSSFFGSHRTAGAGAQDTPARDQPAGRDAADAGAETPADPGAGEAATARGAAGDDAASGGPAAAPGVIDPMQWWTALSTQFQQIAAHAMQDVAQHQSALDATRTMATEAVKTATGVASQLAAQGMQGMQDVARKASTGRSASAKAAAGKPASGRSARADGGAAKPKAAAAKSAPGAAAGGVKKPAAKAAAKASGPASKKASAGAKAPAPSPRTARSRPAR